MKKLLRLYNDYKIEILIIVLSLTVTGSLSVAIGIAGSSIIGPFWSWATLAFIAQIVGFVFWNTKRIERDRLIEAQLLDKVSKFFVPLQCAYCSQKNMVPIQLNEKNTFKCDSCNQVNGVFMQFTATTITTPLEAVSLPLKAVDAPLEFRVSS